MNPVTVITTILILCFFALMISIGIRTRRHAQDVNGFVLGSRNVGPWLSAFAFGTSYFSAVIFVGYAGQFGWNFGLASTWIGLGNAFIGSLLAWSILGRRTRIMTQHLSSKTMPDFFGARFESKNIKVAASVITFVFLIPYTASLYNGLSRLFAMAYDGIDYSVCVIVMAVLTGVYVIIGGYMATALNDFIQGMIMLVGIIAVIGAVLHNNGRLMGAMGTIATNENAGWQFVSFLGPDPLFLIFVVMLTSLGTWGLPQMVSKFYAIDNEDSIKKGTIISTFFALIVAGGCYFLGGFGRLFVPTAFNAEKGKFVFDNIVPTMLESLPDVLIALVILLVLSASMSTLAGLVLTSSSTMTLDLIYRDKKSQIGEVEGGEIDDMVAEKIERRKVIIMRVLIVFFIALSLMIALNPPQFIAQLMGISWGALAGAFLAPFMLGLYWKGVTSMSVWACFVWGVGLTVVNMVLGNPINPIDCGAIAMLGGFVVVAVVSLVTSKMKQDTVDAIFKCYE